MAYKAKSTWKAKIQVEENNAESVIVVEFKHSPRNRDVKKEVAKAEGKEEPRDYVEEVLDAIVSISGLEDENGKALGKEDLRTINDNRLIAAIITAFGRGSNKIFDPEANEKKFIGIE